MEIGKHYVSSGMVLQRGKLLQFEGETKGSDEIAVTFAGIRQEAVIQNGRFYVNYRELQAGGPYRLEIEYGDRTECMEDILIGDVYFMSGQSNMAMRVEEVYHSFAEEIDACDYDNIRQFTVETDYNFVQPEQDVKGSWHSACGTEKYGFGALGFFMAKKLYEKEQIPIGLIQTAVPGCPIESFLSQEACRTFSAGSLPQICFSKKEMALQKEREEQRWKKELERYLAKDSAITDFEEKAARIPVLLKEKSRNCSGIYTFQREIILEEEPVQDCILKMGIITEADITFVNGIEVGNTPYQYPQRRYRIPQGILKKGRNVITVKVLVTQGICRFWEKQTYMLFTGTESIDLQAGWHFHRGYFEQHSFLEKTCFEYYPYGVYNAMLAPFDGLMVKALLWYQGESNTGKPEGYYEKFKTLAAQFRKLFREKNLPVYFVQIADYEDMNDSQGRGWEAIRQIQEEAGHLENMHMIVSKDIGDPTDLHPQNKKMLGERLGAAIENEK